MEGKTLAYVGIGFLVLLLMGGLFSLGRMNGNIIKESQTDNSDLNKYQPTDIPEECKPPAGQDLQSWKEHLGHHQNTLYCLDYFK